MTMVKCGDGDRGSERAMMGRMLRTYLLLRSVVAFREDTKQVFTIPAGALVRLPESMHRLGIEYTSWGGYPVMVSREDVEENGLDVAVERQCG